MAILRVPNSVTIHTARSFFDKNARLFTLSEDRATLHLNRRWMHLEPMALSAISAWGAWCRRHGRSVIVRGLSPRADYMWRMKVFEHLGVDYHPSRHEFEESGRFLPVTNVRVAADIRSVIADVSALLHLDSDPPSLRAVQHCISELLRNVIEHSDSPDGAFVSAHNYSNADPRRVTIGIADCGVGIREHLRHAYPRVATDDAAAVMLAMTPGVTGAIPGMYGSPENAGAGLFITRSIAKGTGGYFLIGSGNAAYRSRRTRDPAKQAELHADAADERHDLWRLKTPWRGTLVSLEIHTERISDVDGYFQWIRDHLPGRPGVRERIRFS